MENAVWVDVMHEVEASGDWSDGFYVADSFELADNVSEFSLGVSEDKAG